MATSCVIFDIANSIMPNRLEVLMERLKLEHQEGYSDMKEIQKSYYFGSRDKDYLTQSLKIKLGLNDKELKDLDFSAELLEKFFGPVLRLLVKARVQLVLTGNAGHEDALVLREFASAQGVSGVVLSSEIGQMFGEPGAMATLASSISDPQNSVFISSSDVLLAQAKSSGICTIKFTNYFEMINQLFSPAGGA